MTPVVRALLATCTLGAAVLAAPGVVGADFGYVGSIGSVGTDPGQLFRVGGTAFDPTQTLMYVADSGNDRVQRFHLTEAGWTLDTSWNGDGAIGGHGSGAGQFDHPIDVAVDAAGRLYVLEGGGLADPGSGQNRRVQRYDGDTGGLQAVWSLQGGTGGFPAGIAVQTAPGDPATAHVDVFVGTGRNEEVNQRVEKYDKDGAFELMWGWGVEDGASEFQICTAADNANSPCKPGAPGLGDGQFRRLMGIATDASGFVYTIDGTNRRVQKFNPDGTMVTAPQTFKFDITDPDSSDCCTADGKASEYPGIDVSAITGLVFVAGSGSVRAFTADGQLQPALTQRCPGRLWSASAHAPVGATSDELFVGAEESILRFGDAGRGCLEPPPGTPPPGGGPPPAPIGFNGTEGVTIGAGALYTNDPAVELTIVAPSGATDVLLSNDGGFATPDRRPIGDHHAWTLVASGLSERLPRAVYVRFANAATVSAQTFTDDIILDTIPPTATVATYQPAPVGAAATAARTRRFIVRVRARDNASGVAKMQFAVSRRRPSRLRRYARRVTVRAARPPAWVRVTDRAGNVSKWRRVRARR